MTMSTYSMEWRAKPTAVVPLGRQDRLSDTSGQVLHDDVSISWATRLNRIHR